MKIAIIYRGNIRGFKYDICFKSHETLYNELNNKNIEFDVYLCTNDIEYNDKNIKLIPNLVVNEICKLNVIRQSNDYNIVFNNITFTGPWGEYYQHNIITYFYNNNYLFNKINKKYDKYLLLDISQIITEFNCNLLNDKNNYISSFESNNGYNTRIIIANHDLFKHIMTQFEYIKFSNNLSFHNPECFNNSFLNNFNLIKRNDLKVFRIRENGDILSF